jgi:DNA-binding GntR family transcriptional regulator
VPARKPADAPYEQVAAALRADIAAGRYPPGERLPTERALAERFGVERPTIRLGIQLLVAEGLVRRRVRIGTWVTEGITVAWDLTGDPAPAAAEVSTAEPDDQVGRHRLGDILDFTGGELAIRRTSLIEVGDQPALIAADYIPLTLAQDTPLMHKAAADPVGIVPAGGTVEEFRVRTATPEEATQLAVPVTAPVLESVRRVGPATSGQRPRHPLVRYRVYRTGPDVTFTHGT